MQRILIDGRFIGVGDSMSRYTLELVKGYLTQSPDFEFTLLVRPQGEKIARDFLSNNLTMKQFNPTSPRLRGASNVTIDILDIPHYTIKEQVQLLSYLNKNNFDLVHFIQFNHPVRYRGKFVVSIHDLTLFGHLYRKNKLKGLAFQQVMKSAVKNSAKIITISETSKAAIVESYKVDPEKIVVTYLGVDEKYNAGIRNKVEGIRQVKSKYKINADYILYTGMWKRHKNLLRLLKAFEIFSQKSKVKSQKLGIQLVLAGKIDKNEPEVLFEIKRINLKIAQLLHGSIVANNHVTMKQCNNCILPVGFVDEADLPYLYAGALAYCIPSLSEGFGLPPLEAMAVGTPVISSNVSAMPEILGEAALYFDPYDEKDIEKAIERIVFSEPLRLELSKKGIEQSKKYSWSKTAKETLEVYKEVI